MQNGLTKGVRASRNGPIVSHILFINDCTLFGDATSRGIKVMKDVLKEYEQNSRQCINFDKSMIFF